MAAKSNVVTVSAVYCEINGKSFADETEMLAHVQSLFQSRKVINDDIRATALTAFSRVSRAIVGESNPNVIRAVLYGFMVATNARKLQDSQVKVLIGLTDCPKDVLSALRF